MATKACRLFQDQNLRVHFDGAGIGAKNNVPKAAKKGGLGVRKALNDVSNSVTPSAIQGSKKHISTNVISSGGDFGASKTAAPDGGKANISKAQEKVRVGSRKALTDLTNSGKPSVQQISKKSHSKKLNTILDENYVPRVIAEERFLHNHEECIKAQRKGVDMDKFLKIVGLDNDISEQASPLAPSLSRNSKPESSLKHLEMEEMWGQLIKEQLFPRKNTDLPNSPPPCRSPESPRTYFHWEDCTFSDFVLKGTP